MSWKIDPAHTDIHFSGRHMMVSTVRGSFKDFTAEVEINLTDLTKSSASVVIQAASLETRDPNRDGHLKSADFLDVEKYPEVKYQSRTVESRGGDRYSVVGDLTIKDITKPIELEVTALGVGTNPYGLTVAGFEATGKFRRSDFGLVWNMALESGGVLVGEDVSMSIDAEVIQEPAEDPVGASQGG